MCTLKVNVFKRKWVFKLRLHTAINRADFVSWCMLYTYEGSNKMHSWENDAVLSVGEPLNRIHQDTKSALINRSV